MVAAVFQEQEFLKYLLYRVSAKVPKRRGRRHRGPSLTRGEANLRNRGRPAGSDRLNRTRGSANFAGCRMKSEKVLGYINHCSSNLEIDNFCICSLQILKFLIQKASKNYLNKNKDKLNFRL